MLKVLFAHPGLRDVGKDNLNSMLLAYCNVIHHYFFLRSFAKSAAFFASMTNGAGGALRLLAVFTVCFDPVVCADAAEPDDEHEEAEAIAVAADVADSTEPCHRPISRNSAPAFVFFVSAATIHSIRFPPRLSAGTGNGRLDRSHQNGTSLLPRLFPTLVNASSK